MRIKKSTTCIIALKNHKGKILIAADRRASFDWSKHVTMNKPKVKKVGQYILAGTGDGALCGLFVDAFIPPAYNGEDLDFFMHHTFYKSVVKTLLSHNYADVNNILKIPGTVYTSIIVAINGHVYTVDMYNPDPDSPIPHGVVAIDEIPTPFATGCGGEHAKGAIDALILQGIKDTRFIAKTAIEVAAMNSPGCDANFDIVVE